MVWIESEKILSACQSGFRKRKSCEDHILRINQSIITGFNNKECTCEVFFDLEKAFDKASHQGIIHKLKKLNVNVFLVKWITNYLQDRTFKVIWNKNISNAQLIRTSCLSPTLFNLYFSDIANVIPNKIHRDLLADDLASGSLTGQKKIRIELQNTITKSSLTVTIES